MIKINDSSIFVNYIKQILTSFPLPNCKILKEDSTEDLIEGKLYLKDSSIVQYINNDFKTILDTYIEGKKYLNYTKTFSNKSLIYDTKTHEYLGEYLRFLRDFKDLNLMPLYNCYSKHFIKNTEVNIKIKDSQYFNIDTNDDNYKYIIIPIKLNNTYTIAVDSNYLEMACIFYGKGYYNISDSNQFTIKTYNKRNYSNFLQPFLFNTINILKDKDISKYKEFIYKHENDLKLLLKLPKNNSSSIVVLEGNYIGTNDIYFKQEDINKLKRNHSIVSFENKTLNEYNNIQFKCQSQLLEYNTKEDNVLSDRLIEYLTCLPITNIEDISQNIVSLQHKLIELWKNSTKQEIRIKGNSTEVITKHPYGIEYIEKEGIWSDYYKALLYSMACNYGLIESKKDILGYVDKDIEVKLGKLSN